jgi:hypothetical protein
MTERHASMEDRDEARIYEIRIQGHLDDRWAGSNAIATGLYKGWRLRGAKRGDLSTHKASRQVSFSQIGRGAGSYARVMKCASGTPMTPAVFMVSTIAGL